MVSATHHFLSVGVVQAPCLRNPQLPLLEECRLLLCQSNPLTLYCRIRTPCGLELSWPAREATSQADAWATSGRSCTARIESKILVLMSITGQPPPYKLHCHQQSPHRADGPRELQLTATLAPPGWREMERNCSRAKAPELGFPRPAPGEMQGDRRSARPDQSAVLQRARLCAITCTASQAPISWEQAPYKIVINCRRGDATSWSA